MTASASTAPVETVKNTHISVLLNEVVQSIAPEENDIIVDGTFGRGGYSRAILNACSTCTVYGIDRDPEAVTVGKAMEQEFPNRFFMLEGCFGSMDTLLNNANITAVNGVMLDIGVSSPQLDDGERGFSFRYDASLDMRMSKQGRTAADIVNETEEEELANLIYQYGEEHASRRIAKAIVTARSTKEITRTGELADIIRSVVPKTGKTDPATKTFQALRIAVNDELGELERGLQAAENILAPQGRLAVVSFHSLEDRIVKQFMRKHSGEKPSVSRYAPALSPASSSSLPDAPFSLPKKSSIKPSKQEEKENPRSRSSRLRIAIRTTAPAFLSTSSENEVG